MTPPASQVRAVAGRAMAAPVRQREPRLGGTRYLQELNVGLGAWEARAMARESEGRTVSWLADATESPRLVGQFVSGDTLKASAAQAVRLLHTQGIRTVLVTGDNRGSAEAVGRTVDIDDVRAEVLSEDKARIVGEFKACGRRVAMVSTTHRRWRRPMSASPSRAVPTWPWRRPAPR